MAVEPDLGASGAADLRVDTQVTSLGDGRYRLALADHWDYMLPSGGVVQTVALRAAAAELDDPALLLCSSTTTFCLPVQRGLVELAVRVLRRGAAMTQVQVDVSSRGELAAVVTATFGRERLGPDVLGARMPAVRSVEDALRTDDDDPRNPHRRFRFYQQLEARIADGERTWTEHAPAGPARYARWLRYRVPQRTASGLLDRLALPPLIDTMPTALQRAIGPIGYHFYAPSLDLTLHVIDDTEREWLLLASCVRRARGGTAIGEIEAWDDRGRLLAVGSQAMFLRGLTGEPPTIDASRR